MIVIMNHKLEFWGQTIWGQWRIWMKNDLREQKLIWFNLEKIFYLFVNFAQTLRTLLKIIGNLFHYVWRVWHPSFHCHTHFSANLHWHATDTHCFLSMISLHSLEALKNVFRLIHNSIKLNYQHISIKIIIIITHKTWVLRSKNLRSMKNLGGK